jgi:hypothetical protein
LAQPSEIRPTLIIPRASGGPWAARPASAYFFLAEAFLRLR